MPNATPRMTPSIRRARKRSSRLPGWPGPYGWVGAPERGAAAPAGGGGGGGTVPGLVGGGGAAASGAGGGGVGSPGGGVDPAGGSVLLMQCSFVGTEVGDVALDGHRGYAVPRCDRAEHSPSSGHMTGPGRAIRTRRRRGSGALAGITSEDGLMSRKPPSRDIDENELNVRHAKDHAAGPTAVAVTMKRAIEQMGVRRATKTLLKLNQVDGFDCQGCAWPDPRPSTGTPPSSARTAPRRSPRRPPGATSAASSSPRTRSPSSTTRPTTGWASRAGSSSRWCCAPAPATTSRSRGTTRSSWSASSCAGWPARTRRSSTPPARRPTRRRSSTSSSPARSAPTTCPTARTCATSPPRWRWPR